MGVGFKANHAGSKNCMHNFNMKVKVNFMYNKKVNLFDFYISSNIL